jgi:arylsulfatase A-like enzyme
MAKLRAKCNAFLGEASGKPIFLYLNLYAPHAPWPRDVQGSPRVKVTAEQVGFFPFMGTNDESAGMRQQIADYYTCVNRADEGLGVLMDLVRERGLSTNTLVVLLGDNGPPFPHAKVSSFEAGVNTPLAITWPGRVKAQVSDALVCGIDFLPTFCEVAGVKPPAGLPGRSRLPLLRGEPVPWREWLKAVGYYTAALNKTPHMKPDACFPWDDALDGSGKNPPLMREQFATTLKHAAAANKPFFINVNIQDPHRPFPGSSAVDAEEGNSTQPQAETAKGKGKKARRLEKNKTKYDQMRTYRPEEIKVPEFLEDIPPVRTEVAQYYTGVARLDISLRGVLDVLKANGHEDDTIVLFLSDHGMSFPFSKATVYFNGTRSPVIVKYPGMPAAARHEEFVSSVDILPTLLERRWRRPAKPTSASPPA